MVRSPHAHARILRINTEAARAMPGILDVLTEMPKLWDANVFGERISPPNRLELRKFLEQRSNEIKDQGEKIALPRLPAELPAPPPQ